MLQQMRHAIREQKYRISSHANDEMADDHLDATDIENIIFTGKIMHRFTHDPRGTRYEVLGDTIDNRRAFAVCRFLESGTLLIITAYVKEKR
jgi:hypothetical protein